MSQMSLNETHAVRGKPSARCLGKTSVVAGENLLDFERLDLPSRKGWTVQRVQGAWNVAGQAEFEAAQAETQR